jgi:hypothetical protein
MSQADDNNRWMMRNGYSYQPYEDNSQLSKVGEQIGRAVGAGVGNAVAADSGVGVFARSLAGSAGAAIGGEVGKAVGFVATNFQAIETNVGTALNEITDYRNWADPIIDPSWD